MCVHKACSLDDIDRYKATELRQLLLHTGKIILKDILHKEYYNHFLVLNTAISILISKAFYYHTLFRVFTFFVAIFY